MVRWQEARRVPHVSLASSQTTTLVARLVKTLHRRRRRPLKVPREARPHRRLRLLRRAFRGHTGMHKEAAAVTHAKQAPIMTLIARHRHNYHTSHNCALVWQAHIRRSRGWHNALLALLVLPILILARLRLAPVCFVRTARSLLRQVPASPGVAHHWLKLLQLTTHD